MRNENMRIVHCPKGGRIPEGYCKNSCLNRPGAGRTRKDFSLLTFPGKDESWDRLKTEDSARTAS